MSVDKITKRWMRDASDEFAVSNGCRFNEERGQFTVDWIEQYLCLYEGVWAGQPFRCEDDWQYEGVMRAFGWERPNIDWRKEVDSDWIRRFRKWTLFIAKKNKKTPTLAAIAIYMLAGDGVMGQKCYMAAKDGAQVRQNLMRHVVEMVEHSEELSAECKINRNEMSVFHEPTRSLAIPLSSSNVRTEKSKEGLNGSNFVDEVHVVDLSLMRRVSRAGISRPEPLDCGFSTVGDDVDSYGFSDYSYADKVSRGETKDDSLLAMIYAAPQDLKAEDLAKDPVKYGKMANPAWGGTVKESEFLADYNRSKGSLRELADFMMYRLNVWQATATPWLDLSGWDARKEESFIDPELPCYGGLDLSSKRDFTGWRIVQRHGDDWHTEGHSWITEARAQMHHDAGLNIQQWERDGWVTIIPGQRINYNQVTDRVLEDAERYNIETVGHDPWQAEAARQVLEAAGLTMVEVTQGYRELSDPCKELEAAVADQKVVTSSDPCLRWMAKNVTVKRDNKDNIFPIKPNRDEMKAIDGIVALVMAIGQAATAVAEPSVFETAWDL